jgi:hypothetical protein
MVKHPEGFEPRLASFAMLKQLRALDVAFRFGRMVSLGVEPGFLVQLAPQLRVLRIRFLDATPVADLTHERFGAVLERLPNLVDLAFLVSVNTTPVAIRDAGERCRRLESLALREHCFFWVFDEARVQPLFPMLRCLSTSESYELSNWKVSDWG